MPGERLCAACKSALKRARDTTVSEAILPVRRARRRPAREAAGAVAPGPRTGPASPAPIPWARHAVTGLAIVAVLGAGGAWLAHSRGTSGAIAPRYSVGPGASGAETIKAAANADTGPSPPSAAAPALPAGTRADAPRAPIDPLSMPASIALPRGAVHVDPAPRPNDAPPARGSATDPGLGAFPAEIPAPAPVVVAQVPSPKPVQDRWQRLGDALGRCPPNDVIARTVCQESLRIEQCDGYWGRVAQCPARPERDYGN